MVGALEQPLLFSLEFHTYVCRLIHHKVSRCLSYLVNSAFCSTSEKFQRWREVKFGSRKIGWIVIVLEYIYETSAA